MQLWFLIQRYINVRIKTRNNISNKLKIKPTA